MDKAPSNRSGGTWISFRGVGYQAAERMGILPRLVEAQLPWEDIQRVEQMSAISPRGTCKVGSFSASCVAAGQTARSRPSVSSMWTAR